MRDLGFDVRERCRDDVRQFRLYFLLHGRNFDELRNGRNGNDVEGQFAFLVRQREGRRLCVKELVCALVDGAKSFLGGRSLGAGVSSFLLGSRVVGVLGGSVFRFLRGLLSGASSGDCILKIGQDASANFLLAGLGRRSRCSRFGRQRIKRGGSFGLGRWCFCNRFSRRSFCDRRGFSGDGVEGRRFFRDGRRGRSLRNYLGRNGVERGLGFFGGRSLNRSSLSRNRFQSGRCFGNGLFGGRRFRGNGFDLRRLFRHNFGRRFSGQGF